MDLERYKISDCEKSLCNCKEFGLKQSNFCSSTTENPFKVESLVEKLRSLPPVKARPGFDQRMAAAFAMELERETQERNRSWLKKNSQISLPDMTSDLIKDLF